MNVSICGNGFTMCFHMLLEISVTFFMDLLTNCYHPGSSYNLVFRRIHVPLIIKDVRVAEAAGVT